MAVKTDMNREIDRVLLSEEQIRQRVAELGAQLSEEYDGKNVILVCILKGAVHFFSDLCLQIVECGKTVQEDRAVFCVCHHFFCHFIWRELFNPLLPYFVRLSHGYPYICVDNVGIFCSLFYIGCQRDRCT